MVGRIHDDNGAFRIMFFLNGTKLSGGLNDKEGATLGVFGPPGLARQALGRRSFRKPHFIPPPTESGGAVDDLLRTFF